jgi:hypothetical protein
MEPQRFDQLARVAAQGASRRSLLRAGVGALAGALLLGRRATAQPVCNPPFILCDGACFYSLTSNLHCGTCGNACGDQVCVDGVCTSCEAIGLTTCEDEIGGDLYCADLAASDIDCGVCGNVCTTGPCVEGVCTSTVDCDPGLTECWGSCVDLQTDTFHCGSCFVACAGEVGPGESSVGECIAGICYGVCQDGYTLCDGACVDLASDATNCGECGRVCDSGECLAGTCTPAEGDGDDDDEEEDPTAGDVTSLPATGSGAMVWAQKESRWTAPALVGTATALAAGWYRLVRRETTESENE